MERRKNAFTLIELLVVIAIIALLIGILLPALGQAQRSAKNVLSQSNLRSLNTGAANYAADNNDQIFSYSWRRGGGIKTMPDGRPKDLDTASDDQQAAAWQNQEILQRVTGRWGKNQAKFQNYEARLPHRRFSHLVLLDFLTDVQPEPIAASPFDRNLLQWQENPADFGPGSGVPYSSGDPGPGYDDDPNWDQIAVKQRWPFASTYQMVPAAWNSDGINGAATYTPVDSTPHLMQAMNGQDGSPPPLGRRKFTHVAHSSGKVMMFEEFDRFSSSTGLYFAYPEAKPNLAFFDGSVRGESSEDSNPGWNPRTPGEDWTQRYVPIDTFPPPKEGLENNNTAYCQRFRWTRHGLQGIDFGGKDVGRRQYGLPQEPADGCVVAN